MSFAPHCEFGEKVRKISILENYEILMKKQHLLKKNFHLFQKRLQQN